MALDETIAQRYIIRKDGSVRFLFNEKCLCGSLETKRNKDDSDYATCLSCLRVLRIMEMVVPDGILTWWGVYFDPYLMEGLAGQFINSFCVHLPEERYPRPLVEQKGRG